ncbi:MAG: 1-phosphofructokinase [Vibrionaceae bacterium]
MKPILTVTLNPAIDLTGTLVTLHCGAVNPIPSASFAPGGKGLNVAKVLADLGASTTATGFLGAQNQDLFSAFLQKNNITDCFKRIKGVTRTNVKVVEQSGVVTDLNFPGAAVSTQDIAALEEELFTLAKQSEYVVVAGSMPPGFNGELLRSWLTKLKQAGCKVLFDSSREALAAGLSAAPWLIKPNHEELSQWANKKLNTIEEIQEVAQKLAQTGIEHVVISRGEHGVLWLTQGRWLASTPPPMQVVSTVGAGDSLVAGLCFGLTQGWPHEQTLAFATALSALAVTQTNVGVESIEQVHALAATIQIKL